jgi:Sec-independent protein translocase protein TatA
MKFLNVGALELLFILLLAFIVLGPEKAIKTAGDVARWIRDLTKSEFWRDLVSTSKEIQNLPKALIEDDELQRTFDDIKRSTGEIKTTFKEGERETGIEPRSKNDNIEKDSELNK